MTDSVPNRGPGIDAVQISMIVATTVVVTLRFISRKIAQAGLWWDDWMILAALVRIDHAVVEAYKWIC